MANESSFRSIVMYSSQIRAVHIISVSSFPDIRKYVGLFFLCCPERRRRSKKRNVIEIAKYVHDAYLCIFIAHLITSQVYKIRWNREKRNG